MDASLHLMDIQHRVLAFCLTWIRRIINSPHSSTAEILAGIFKEADMSNTLTFKRNFRESHEQLAPHPFYLEIISTWQGYNNFNPEDEEHIRVELIWNKQRIKSTLRVLDRSNVKWKRWLQAGIRTVHNLCHQYESRYWDKMRLMNAMDCQ